MKNAFWAPFLHGFVVLSGGNKGAEMEFNPVLFSSEIRVFDTRWYYRQRPIFANFDSKESAALNLASNLMAWLLTSTSHIIPEINIFYWIWFWSVVLLAPCKIFYQSGNLSKTFEIIWYSFRVNLILDITCQYKKVCIIFWAFCVKFWKYISQEQL